MHNFILCPSMLLMLDRNITFFLVFCGFFWFSLSTDSGRLYSCSSLFFVLTKSFQCSIEFLASVTLKVFRNSMDIVDLTQYDCNLTGMLWSLCYQQVYREKTSSKYRTQHYFCPGNQTADFLYLQDQFDVFCKPKLKIKH